MKTFSQAAFLAAAGRAADLPPQGPPEVAFAGRSNVGKSSAINALLDRKRLAYTSKRPGRTQTINFYQLGEAARLVDLPGYGYARVPQPLRAQWRHPLTPLDLQLIEWLGDVPLLVLLSKADKLTRAQQAATLTKVGSLIQAEVRLFSSATRQGVDECRGLLAGWLQAGRGNKRPPAKGI